MSNSTISKSSSFIVSKKLSGEQQNKQRKDESKLMQHSEEYSQKKQDQNSSKQQTMFTPLRKQPTKSTQKKDSIEELRNKSNTIQKRKSTPLFLGFMREEQVIEPISNSNNKEEKISNDLVKTKHTFKPSLQNSWNDSLNPQERENIKKKQQQVHSQRQEQRQQQQQDLLIKKRQFHKQSMMFGEGLQQINTKGQQQNVEPNENQNFSIDQKPQHNSINSTQKFRLSSVTPTYQNSQSIKKLSYKQFRDADYRKTSKSFFKRSLNSQQSQGYLKQSYNNREQQKIESKGSLLNAKSLGNSIKQREQRGSIFFKTQYAGRQSINQNLMYRNPTVFLSLANNLNRLLFKYNGGHATTLYNYRLKIKNESGLNLRIKIKCTSPKHYEVRPCSQMIMQPLQILNLSIQMKLYAHDLNTTTMKHDLSRYKHDKFMIIYWTADSYNDYDFYQGQKILPVCIQQTAQQKLRNEGFTKTINDIKTKRQTEEKQIQLYKKLITNNTTDISQIDMKIKKIELMQYKHKYFSTPLFVIFSMLGLGIGYWMG